MVQGDHWFYIVLEEQVNYVVIVADSCFVNVVVGTTWKNSGPREREAVEVNILFFQKIDVFCPEMIGVAGYITG